MKKKKFFYTLNKLAEKYKVEISLEESADVDLARGK